MPVGELGCGGERDGGDGWVSGGGSYSGSGSGSGGAGGGTGEGL